MSEAKLLLCPFCAAEAVEYAGGQGFPDTFGIVCTDCGASVEDNIDGTHVRKWNDRAVNPDSAALERSQDDIATERVQVANVAGFAYLQYYRIEQLEAALKQAYLDNGCSEDEAVEMVAAVSAKGRKL